ncbi:MAG: glycosyltransferase [Acidimicrobiales bacterium]|nr:glycosyltransferase [Acidimicrobiales bacterium]
MQVVESLPGISVAVLIPCLNEATSIKGVVTSFRQVLPSARIYVYDNGSTDGTADEAHKAGAIVRTEPRPGKGNVVRRMFADIEADVYLMVDGDGTYDPAIAQKMVNMVVNDGHDLVNAIRVTEIDNAYPPLHKFGNSLLTGLVRRVFKREVKDMLSGYKALSRRFVKSFPIFSARFEIETEITVHAMELNASVGELDGAYIDREVGSESKLSTLGDGYRILRAISKLARQGRPLMFFSLIGFILAVVAVLLGIPVVITFFQTHKVPRLPTAILSTGLVLLASLSVTAGFIVDAVTRARIENKILKFLSVPTIQGLEEENQS